MMKTNKVVILTEKQISRLFDNIILEEKQSFRELSEEEEDNAFAAFVVVKLSNNKIAATTRPYEKAENKKIGLPGGKVEKNEKPIDAAYRESQEEGWKVDKIGDIIASKMVKGNPIVYFEGFGAKKLKDYKEKENDIEAIEVTIDEISNTGYGNDFISKYYGETEEMKEQDAAAAAPASGTSSSGDATGYPQVTKWESGVTRGPANQIGVTKWSDVVGQSLKRGKGNTLM
jgi:hypothetical protein